VRQLGAGAMGQVYLAHDTLLDRAVAIKFISAIEIGAGARERFFTEARAVARLSHPNVVGIHRVGEIRQRPYLVSEYVRGTSIDAIAKPLPWERALKIGLGLARGLACAHRRGVLHRDIKPANAIIGDDDEAKLLDFGLAKLMDRNASESRRRDPESANGKPTDPAVDATTSVADRPVRAGERADTPTSIADRPAREEVVASELGLTADGAIVGTPLYLAPELWRGEPASRQTDIYALGVVLYELVAGRAPHAGLAFLELATHVGSENAAPVASHTTGLPARFAQLIDACLSRDPARRPGAGDELCELLEAVVPRAAAAIEGSPYRGLSTFEPEHRALFFGRADETRAVVERLRTETFVVVAGDSGAGKSSLCRAAVLPAVADKALAGRRWRVVTMVPGTRPRASLEAALASTTAGEGLLLFVDQLEELLTIADPDEAADVAERLAELVVATSNIRVLASARSDFLGRLAGLPGIGELVGRALFLLGPLSDRGLREAIVGPARALGYELESPAMIDELVASSRHHLPLLQFTLAELWDARDDQARKIPGDALVKIGGVAGALARRADQVMAALGDGDREIAWRVLVRLMTGEGTRAVMTRAELAETAGDPAAVERVVERLVAARLLVVAPGGDDRVEVVHEALFTGWPRLVAWRRAHEEGARLRDLYAEAARRWHERGRPRGLLWRGDALAEYRTWRRRWTEQPTAIEASFGDANEAEARRTRTVRLTLLAIVLAALSAGIVVLYRSDRRAAEERDVAVVERGEAERQRRALLVEQGLQELANGRGGRALVYFVEAMRQGDDTAALRTLVAEAARPVERELATIHDLPAGIYSIAWAADGSRFAASGQTGLAAAFDRDGKRVAWLKGEGHTANSGLIAFTADGSRVIASADHAVYVWDAATGARQFELVTTGAIMDARLDRAGTRVVTAASDGKTTIFDLSTGALVRTLSVGETKVRASTFSPDGTRVAACAADGSIWIWDAATGATVAHATTEPLIEPQLDCGLRFTPDGTRMVTAGRETRIWDTRTTKPLATLAADRVFFIDLSADGAKLVTASVDGVARVWDTRTGRLLAQLVGHTNRVNFARFAADGRRIVTTSLDRTFRVWDATTGRLELTFDAAVTSPDSTAQSIDARFSPDGTRLLTAVGNELKLLRVGREPLVDEIAMVSPTSARLSPDERRIAAARHTGHVEVWDLERHVQTAIIVLKPILWDVSWSPAGTELLVAGTGLAQIHAAAGGPPLRTFVGHDPKATINRAAYSPDGTHVVTASTDKTAKIWEAATGKHVMTLSHPDRVMAAAWSADGERIATAGWDRTLRIWERSTGRLLDELRDDTLKFLDVTFSPDGTRLAAASHSGVVTLWDLRSRARTISLIGHSGPTTTVVWSPDGALLATSSSDRTARVWDAATGRLLATHIHDDEALQVTWNRSGTSLVVASMIPGVRIWDVRRDQRSIAELVDFVDQRVPWKLVDGRLEVVDRTRTTPAHPGK